MRMIRLGLCAMALAGWCTLAAAAGYETLKPLLADVPGWSAEAAEGANMDMNGMKMVTASRHYQKGEGQSLNAQVGLMPAAMGAPVQAMNINMETDESIVKTATLDGFMVNHTHEKAQNSGSILVFLGNTGQASSALFTLEYEGISAQDAMAMAKRFDWKKMQAATAALH